MKLKLMIKSCGALCTVMLMLAGTANAASFSYTNSSNATISFTDNNCATFSAGAASASLALTCQTTAPTTPQCTVTANPTSLTATGLVTLNATCNPAATSYIWTNATSTTSTATATIGTTTTFTVKGKNDAGEGNVASVTVTVGAVQPPQCTLTASPSTVSSGGMATLTASCSPAATSYTWTNVTATGSTVNVTPTATTTYTVTGSNAGGTGNAAAATVTVTAPTSSFPPATCANNGHPLAMIGADLDWNIGGGIAIYSQGMKAGDGYIYRMTTGAASATLVSLTLAEYASTYVPERTIAISETPCDFDPASVNNAYGVGTNPTVYFSVGLPNTFGYIALKANTTYYVNIKNAYWQQPDVDTCPAGKDCRFVMSLRK